MTTTFCLTCTARKKERTQQRRSTGCTAWEEIKVQLCLLTCIAKMFDRMYNREENQSYSCTSYFYPRVQSEKNPRTGMLTRTCSKNKKTKVKDLFTHMYRTEENPHNWLIITAKEEPPPPFVLTLYSKRGKPKYRYLFTRLYTVQYSGKDWNGTAQTFTTAEQLLVFYVFRDVDNITAQETGEGSSPTIFM